MMNRSKTITAEIELPLAGANGTIIAQGGRFGGWSLYVKDGVPAYGYNFEKVAEGRVAHTQAIIVSADETADAGPGQGRKEKAQIETAKKIALSD